MTRSKISAPFVYKNIYNDVISEFDIEYVPGVNSGSKLLEFLDMFNDRHINIVFPKGIDMKYVEPLKSFENFRIRVSSTDDLYKIQDLSKIGVKFFLDENFCAVNWKQLDDQLFLGCDPIYVKDDLTHALDMVYNICASNDIGIRCVLNHVQSTGPFAGVRETDWFVRPEDMDYAEGIYSAFEFDCSYMTDNKYEWSKFDALYTTFFDRRKYVGNMQELNFQLGFVLNNDSCIEQYVSRSNCGFMCAQGSSCEKCRHIKELSDLMHGKGMVITK